MIDGLFSIDSPTARALLQQARDGVSVGELGAALHIDGTGRAEQQMVLETAVALEAVRRKTPKRPVGGVTRGGHFEANANELLHRRLAALPRQVLLDRGFWRWISVTMLREIIDWRHNAEDGVVKDLNFGIGAPVEGLAYRLFMRADLALDVGAEDPYWLSRFPNQDLWRSHLLRQNYGRAFELRRALLMLQHGHLDSVKPLHLTNKGGGFRDLAKQLRNLGTNTLFEALDREDAEALVKSEAKTVIKLSTGA